MKTGLENKRNVITLAVLGAVLIPSLWFFVDKMFLTGGPPPAAPPAVSATSAPAAGPGAAGSRTETANGHAAKKVASLESLDPTLHPELMAGAEALVYAGSGRNIFSMSSAPPKIEEVAGPVRATAPGPTVVAQTGPPPPPPIDLTFFGYEAHGDTKKAFILHGDDVFIAAEGDVVDHHFKVVKISPLSIQVTDLLYNNTQTLSLAQS
ncbi:MAG TPA: hypothetical protein VHX60_08060 [Acidobacteriaceae bacterium]|jgi:hypothetical protein|nr:hypothetical protein [Acidobacteriaceae bacterium]